MQDILPGLVIGFREGLEAFLVVAVALRFVSRAGRPELRRSVWAGAVGGALSSLAIGLGLFAAAEALGGAGRVAKLWESGASLVALALVTTFIVWMIRHGAELNDAVERRVSAAMGGAGLALAVGAMVLREGVEVALFTYAGTYPAAGIALGIAGALALVALVFLSLVKVNLRAIFNVTLAYLVLQAGFLLGYGIHEGLSAMKDAGLIDAASPFLAKAFNLSGTVLDHKAGALGIPLYALAGWYSKPEWIQFAAQYLYTAAMFASWIAAGRRKAGTPPKA